ncbi:hypothetical protein [Flaviflexus equikiangi]|uniref:hypothetical protein n=1 Tax=Flaviflexus equikiangi TaxID=2758573 RepID=UPI0015F6BE4F|nr:hypothetical protein [Flaviflexus equikiangi]
MAKATINLPTTFLDALNAADTQLGQFAKDALTAGAAIVEPRMRANLAGAIGSGTKLIRPGFSSEFYSRIGTLCPESMTPN